MIHEWWGLNDNIRAMADRLAAEGYIVLAVDLYGGKVATNAAEARQFMLEVVEDTRWFGDKVLGLTTTSVWITTPVDGVLDADFLGALDRLTDRLEGDPAVGSVVGLPSILRLRRYAAGGDARLPTDAAGLKRVAAAADRACSAGMGRRRLAGFHLSPDHHQRRHGWRLPAARAGGSRRVG